MALSYTARRRWSLIILLIGLPVYIVLAVTLTGWIESRFGRPSFLVEVAVYVALGLLLALAQGAVRRCVACSRRCSDWSFRVLRLSLGPSTSA